jgi:hypothetical protein
MLILDCSSRSQALLTLSAGLGCATAVLETVLLSLDLDYIYETNHPMMVAPNQYLREYVCAVLGEAAPFARALWFHGTRTVAGNTFPSGLLALNHSESLAMKMLLDQAPNDIVRQHLQEWDVPGGVPDEMFQLRTGDKNALGTLRPSGP